MPGMPRVPGITELVTLLQAQTEVLAQLPRTLVDLNRSVLALIEVLNSARDTAAATQRLTQRLDRIMDELEAPALALRPGLERLAIVLNDPVVEEIPGTLRTLSEEIIPLVQGLRETQSKISTLASSPERILGLVDEAGIRLAKSPLGSLWRARRTHSDSGEAAPTTQMEEVDVSLEVVERLDDENRRPNRTS